MTKAKIKRANNGLVSVRILGHANFSANGEDIVCAGISTLAISFAQTVSDYANREEVTISEINMLPGDVTIKYIDYKKKLEPALTMLLNGLQGIESKYSKNLCTEWGEIEI